MAVIPYPPSPYYVYYVYYIYYTCIIYILPPKHLKVCRADFELWEGGKAELGTCTVFTQVYVYKTRLVLIQITVL